MNDNRLLTCAKLCKKGKAVDVGTDHGHLAEYLIKNNICDSCVACDINEKPLESARQTVINAGLEDKINLVLSDGLDNIDCTLVNNVIMAGMGGELISDIIGRADWLKENRVNLVLQPMTKWDFLRKFLYDNNFSVTNELACEDGKFVYSVMQAVYTGEEPEYACDGVYLSAGKVTGENFEGKLYLNRQAQRLEVAGQGMIKSEDKKHIGEQMLQVARKLREMAEEN